MMIKMCQVWVKRANGFDAPIHPDYHYFSPERAREIATEYKRQHPGAETVIKFSGYEFHG